MILPFLLLFALHTPLEQQPTTLPATPVSFQAGPVQTGSAQAGSTQDGSVQDEPLSVPAIVYPPDARRQRITGVVQLQVSVDATGKVSNVRVLSGPIELRQAAVDAYYGATYKPLERNGKPIPATVNTAVNFTLADAGPQSVEQADELFTKLHSNCQQLSLDHSADALATCRRAVEVARTLRPGYKLNVRATAYNDLVLLLIAPGKYAGKDNAAPNPALPEAGEIADQAVDLVSGTGVHNPALATAYITRAEVRSLAGDLRGAVGDCVTAEEVLNNLIADQAAPTEQKFDKTTNYKSELRDVYELHAVILDRQHKGKEAHQIRAREDAV